MAKLQILIKCLLSPTRGTGSRQGVEGTFEFDSFFKEAYKIKSTDGQSIELLDSGEMTIIVRHPSVFLEQKKRYVTSRSYFNEGGRKSTKLITNDSKTNDVA